MALLFTGMGMFPESDNLDMSMARSSASIQCWVVALTLAVTCGCSAVSEPQQGIAETGSLNIKPLAELTPAALGPFEVPVPLYKDSSQPTVPDATSDPAGTLLSRAVQGEPAEQLPGGVVKSDGTTGFLSPQLQKSTLNVPFQTGRENGFIAIAYHRIADDDSPYTVTPEDFAAQIQHLSEGGFNSVTLDQLARYYDSGENLPERAVLITVDDGHRTSFSTIYPTLREYGFSAVYFPYSDFIDNGGLSTSMIRQMIREGGAEIGVHTKTHAALTLQGEFETDQDYRNRVLDEIAEPAALLGAISGTNQIAIAYPYGKVNRQVEGLARTVGLDFGFTVNCALNTRSTNRLRLNRCTIDRADGVDLFATKIVNPKLAMRRIARKGGPGGATPARVAPEYLGSLANREYFTGVPIEPFSAYFVHPEGKQIKYAARGLPAGLSIDASSGLVSGTPQESAGDSRATIIAIDGESGARTRSNSFNIKVY